MALNSYCCWLSQKFTLPLWLVLVEIKFDKLSGSVVSISLRKYLFVIISDQIGSDVNIQLEK
jgi:hypothetical protein